MVKIKKRKTIFLTFSEYYPQNIMYDKRVARGSTYAAMVIPAGTNPDAMMTEKRQEERKNKVTLKVF